MEEVEVSGLLCARARERLFLQLSSDLNDRCDEDLWRHPLLNLIHRSAIEIEEKKAWKVFEVTVTIFQLQDLMESVMQIDDRMTDIIRGTQNRSIMSASTVNQELER